MKIGVVLPNWIGDVVMATPALHALKQRFGGTAELVGVMRPYVTEVLAGSSLFDRQITSDSTANALQRVYRLARQLRQERFDQLILLSNSYSTALAARLGRARHVVGYSRYWRGWLLTQRLSPLRTGGHYLPISAVDYYLRLARRVGCRETGRKLHLATLPADEAAAAAVWQHFGLDPAATVVLNTGGAYGAAKRWPAEYFGKLARRVAGELPASVLVVCGPAEREAAAEICRVAAHPRVASLADWKLGIGLTKACVRRSQLMVTTDSGPRHFAAAFDVPAVTLFGPTDPRLSHNYHPWSLDLSQPVPCAPCARRTCPLKHHRCMTELTVLRVYQAVAQLWQMTAPLRSSKLAATG